MGLFDIVYKRVEGAKEENERLRQTVAYELEKPQLLNIISESVEIIKTSENLKIALGRFDLIRNSYGRLLALDPQVLPLFVSVEEWVSPQEMTTHIEIMQNFERAKKGYILKFFKSKIEVEQLKADSLSDKKLKKAQLKKALKTALDGLAYLPKEAEIKSLIATIEAQVACISCIPDEKGK